MLAAGGLAVGTSACGSSAAPPAPAAAPTHPSAATILTRMRHSLQAVHSLRVVFRQSGAHHRRTQGWYAVSMPGRVSATVQRGGRVAAVRMIGARAWGREGIPFWTRLGDSSDVARALANHWFVVPAGTDPDLAQIRTQLSHTHFARCLVTDSMSGLHYAGSGAIDGVPAYELKSRGTKPGTATGRLWISAQKPYYPLREVQTSRYRAGAGPDPVCGQTAHDRSPGQNGTHASVTYEGFNDPVSIKVPAHPLSKAHPLTEADVEDVSY